MVARARLLVFGASGHGKVVADAAACAGIEVIGFADDDPAKRGTSILDYSIRAIGHEEAVQLCRRESAHFAVAIGANAVRKSVFDTLRRSGLEPLSVVHPAATMARSVRLGPGVVVFAGAVINPDAVIAENVIINTGATVDHDCVLGAHAHLSPGVHLGGIVLVGEGTHVGVGASIRNNIRIGSWSVIGAGAAVVSDVPDGVVAFGVPARVQWPIQG